MTHSQGTPRSGPAVAEPKKTHRATLAATALLLVALTACGQSSAPESPAQVLADGRQAFHALRSFHVSGTLTVNQSSGVIAATVLPNGDATGNLLLGSESANFVVLSRITYFDTLNSFVEASLDASTLYLVKHLKGQHWWRAPGSAPVATALQLLNPVSFSALFIAGRSQLTLTTEKDSRGRSGRKLDDTAGAVYIQGTPPHEILEVRSAPNYLAGGASSVDLVLDRFNVPATVAAPTSFVTPIWSQMPPYFFVDSVAFNGNCNASGCPLKAVIKASAGNGGPVAVSLWVYDENHKTLGTCGANVVLRDVWDSETATCRATGSAWTYYWNNSTSSVYGDANVANPDYNP